MTTHTREPLRPGEVLPRCPRCRGVQTEGCDDAGNTVRRCLACGHSKVIAPPANDDYARAYEAAQAAGVPFPSPMPAPVPIQSGPVRLTGKLPGWPSSAPSTEKEAPVTATHLQAEADPRQAPPSSPPQDASSDQDAGYGVLLENVRISTDVPATPTTSTSEASLFKDGRVDWVAVVRARIQTTLDDIAAAEQVIAEGRPEVGRLIAALRAYGITDLPGLPWAATRAVKFTPEGLAALKANGHKIGKSTRIPFEHPLSCVLCGAILLTAAQLRWLPEGAACRARLNCEARARVRAQHEILP